MSEPHTENTDVVLVGCGIMSATLGILLKTLDPKCHITIFERLDSVAGESSQAWNNAGTGHAALCELNYTAERADGTIDISRALHVDEEFEQSKQLWAWLAARDMIDPARFIESVPHLSFVQGEADVRYLRERHAAMDAHPLFHGMAFTDVPRTIAEWAPLIMDGRSPMGPIAATRSLLGTGVDFGELTVMLFDHLKALPGIQLHLGHQVRDLARTGNDRWEVRVRDRHEHDKMRVRSPFVFIGAGGGTLPLLERSGIPEAEGYGGFPVGGQWLRCTDPAVIGRHAVKVYGKAKEGAPPMSVPHLDHRTVAGKPALLFGPFAGFSTKFLKHGSWLDLPSSLEWENLGPMLSAGWKNLDLTRYLIHEVRLSPEERLEELKAFMPTARMEDWGLAIAGQRVQVIKKDPDEGGVLAFGTELVTSTDGSLAALLGASPGASTAVSIMLDLLERCFPDQVANTWKATIQDMVPSHGHQLAEEPDLIRKVREHSHKVLRLLPPSAR
ncbi:MAG: malate dehydrogenase (quinone) [Flavobacteriales bacterium]|nr:malate dehydrogenase (quinone) [Flavobacteriales bacterium]